MSSPPNHLQSRSIEALEDVVLVLDSPSASFEELMDCVAVAKWSGDLRLARLAAEQAFSQLTEGDRPESETVRRAAEAVVRGYVAQASSEHTLPRQLRRAKAWLGTQRSVLEMLAGPEYVDDEMRLLSEVQALLSTSNPDDVGKLRSGLDRLDRPDLASTVRP